MCLFLSQYSIITRLLVGQSKNHDSIPGARHFFCKVCRPALRCTQRSIHCVPQALYPGVKWPLYLADCCPSISTDVKNMWAAVPPLPHMHSLHVQGPFYLYILTLQGVTLSDWTEMGIQPKMHDTMIQIDDKHTCGVNLLVL